MKIKIDDDYQVTADSRQYILQENKVVLEGEKKGNQWIVNLGYYGTITQALKGYKELRIRNSNVSTVEELLKFIKGLDEKIETLLGGN